MYKVYKTCSKSGGIYNKKDELLRENSQEDFYHYFDSLEEATDFIDQRVKKERSTSYYVIKGEEEIHEAHSEFESTVVHKKAWWQFWKK